MFWILIKSPFLLRKLAREKWKIFFSRKVTLIIEHFSRIHAGEKVSWLQPPAQIIAQIIKLYILCVSRNIKSNVIADIILKKSLTDWNSRVGEGRIFI